MNIARGLFRLWLVLTGLWVLWIAAICYDSIANPTYVSRGFYFLKDTSKAVYEARQDKLKLAPGADWGTFQIKTPNGFIYFMEGTSGDDAYKRLMAGIASSTYQVEPMVARRGGRAR